MHVEGVVDTFASGMWQPTVNEVRAVGWSYESMNALPSFSIHLPRAQQINSLFAAKEAACVILSINPRSKQPGEAHRNSVGLGPRGGPVSAGRGGAGMAGMVEAGRGRSSDAARGQGVQGPGRGMVEVERIAGDGWMVTGWGLKTISVRESKQEKENESIEASFCPLRFA